ncbi:hypothetical protein CXF80_19025 [Shewanella sp. Actino-trap-3]|jgi:hypothetical protein|uniref:hypothetical protein n=1 Tax=Shewanella sp. Actino-trap-3 TaxID=2058331 RepID=UPI000C323A68|nr:hypothetical protein [Shewanella sp. Actino-trap-3]PKG80221.1 hypothetical protein CXF80_19025 [Shewanella sp. Actino-trap-3]
MSCDWLPMVKDIVVACSAFGAACIAYKGLGTWQKELKGKSEYQLAKDVLRCVYEVREGFKHVRNPVIFTYEYPEDMITNSGHLKKEFKHKGTAHVYQERFKKLDLAFIKLEEKNLEALVEWGSEHQNKISELRERRAELLVSIQDMLRRYEDPEQDDWKTKEERIKEKYVINYMGENPKNCDFTSSINDGVAVFDTWLRSYVSRKS